MENGDFAPFETCKLGRQESNLLELYIVQARGSILPYLAFVQQTKVGCNHDAVWKAHVKLGHNPFVRRRRSLIGRQIHH